MGYETIGGGLVRYSSIISSEKTDSSVRVEAQAIFPESFCGFRGHFPGKPLLPAVVQLGLVRVVGQKALEVNLSTVALEKVKFRGMILPDEKIRIRVHFDWQITVWQASFKLQKTDDSLVASGTAHFRPVFD